MISFFYLRGSDFELDFKNVSGREKTALWQNSRGKTLTGQVGGPLAVMECRLRQDYTVCGRQIGLWFRSPRSWMCAKQRKQRAYMDKTDVK